VIRVACDCRMSDWSGVGRYTRGLVRALAASGEVDLVQIVSPDSEPPVPDAEALVAAGDPFTLGGGRALAASLRAARPDLTHCLHFPTPVPAPRALVGTIHDLSPIVVPGVMPSAVRRAAYRLWNARNVRVSQRIIVPSENTAADVHRIFPRAAQKLRVIPDAADDFSAGPLGALPEYASEHPYLFSMGNTKAHKDLPTLLRAFARIAPAEPGLALLLVGRDVPGFVASVLHDDPAAHRVRFTGAVDDDTLRALYANAAAFVFPSRYEGFGLPVLEAMAFGAPVVVADAASLPEVAGDASLPFPPGDDAALAERLEAVLHDAALRERLVADGREREASFTWAETARRTIAVYREMVT